MSNNRKEDTAVFSQDEQISQLESRVNKAEEELKISNSIFLEVLDGSMAGFWDWHIQENTEYLSPRFKGMFGYEDHELPNHPDSWQKIIHPEDLPGVLEVYNDHVKSKGKIPYDNEVRYFHKDGSIVWVKCRGRVIEWDENDEPVRMVGSHVDITALKVAELRLRNENAALRQAEIALEESRLRFEKTVEGSGDGIWDWIDVTGEEEWWSPRFYQLLGYEDGEIPATLENFSAALHPDDRAHTFAAVQEHFKDHVPFDVVYRLKTKSGEYRWFRARAAVARNAKGLPTRMIGSLSDIHDAKTTEIALQASNEELKRKTDLLARSNAELEQFAYIASHDLQEPLRTIKNFVQLLNQRYGDALDAKAKSYIDFCVDAAERMSSQVNGLLEFSRYGSQEIKYEAVDIGELVVLTERSLMARIVETNAVIKTESLPLLKVDRHQFTHLFQNLIHNGLKFNHSSRPEIKVSAVLANNVWRFCIEDNGIGIEERFHNEIFVIFRRLHTRGKYAGEGLGLALVKRIVENHGGEIWVESEPGSGSQIYFTVPTHKS